MNEQLALFGNVLTYVKAKERLDEAYRFSGGDEQSRALWQIASELNRIASVLEEVHR